MTVFSCLLHVGYMKTATTYLQAAVYDNPAAGFAVPMDGDGRAFIVDQIILSDGFSFDAPAVAGRLEAAAEPLRNRGLIPVWSDESLLGDPVARRYDGHTNAGRLRAVLPSAKVLITIREQKAMVQSMYVEYIRQGGLASLIQFIGTGQERLSFSPILRADYLMFDQAVAFYHALFGKENVLVLPQELLARDKAEYFGQLSDFLHTEIPLSSVDQTAVHKSLGTTANIVRRSTNRLRSPQPLSNVPGQWERALEKGLRLLDRMVPSALERRMRNRLRADIEERYDGVFGESNRRLSDLTGLDLSGFGYD